MDMNEHIARLEEARAQIAAVARRTPNLNDANLLFLVTRELDKAIEAL